MEILFKAAGDGDIDLLIEMMRDFYIHEHLTMDEPAARRALRQILTDASCGRVCLMLADGDVAGYIVLTLGFSLEAHGRDAFVDELYLRESYRRRGIGKRALQFIEGVCRELGVKALHLEVERENTNAQVVYRRAGFVDHDRYLMTRWVNREREEN